MVARLLRGTARATRRAVAGDDFARSLSAGWSGPSDPARPTLPLVVLLLTFTTGLVDAVSYLELGRVFTAFQTGNLVVLGFGLAGTEGFSIAAPAVSLVSFFAGAALGGALAAALSSRHRRWFSLALAVEAALVGVAAAIAAGLIAGVMSDRRYVVIALLAAAMGLRSGTVRRLSVPEVNVTVLTSTITGLAADSGLAGAGLVRRGWQVATIAARLLGAVAGALLVGVSLTLPLLVVAGLIAAAAAAYVAPVVVREHRRRRGPGRR